MKTQNSKSQKISIFHLTNKRSVFNSEKKSTFKKLCTQYLVGNPFAEMTVIVVIVVISITVFLYVMQCRLRV